MKRSYADDLADLACTQAQIRDKADKIWNAANRVDRNQCAENESDVYQHDLRCTSHGRRQNVGMRGQLTIPRKCDNYGWESTKRHLEQT